MAGLSDTVGYSLEDKIMPYIPFCKKGIWHRDHDYRQKKYSLSFGRYDEVNIYAEGMKDGERVYLIGECKARPGKKEITKFSEVLNRVKRHLNAPVYACHAGYTCTPEVERYLKEKHPEIKFMKSIEFEIKYSRQ